MMTMPLLAVIDLTRWFPKSDPQSAPTAIGITKRSPRARS